MSYVKTMQSFGQLKGICTGLGGAYNPGQQHLQVKALTTIQFNAQLVMDEVKVAKTVYDNITNQRELAYRDLRSLSSRILFILRASGVHPLTLADALAANRKVQGWRKYRAAKPRPIDGEDVVDKRRSPSQAFVSTLQHFAELVEVVAAEPMYRPLEPELQVDNLEQRVVAVRSLNEMVLKAEQTLLKARQKRKALFFENDDSLVKVARAARHYIRGVFGFRSEPHVELSKLSLTKPSAR